MTISMDSETKAELIRNHCSEANSEKYLVDRNVKRFTTQLGGKSLSLMKRYSLSFLALRLVRPRKRSSF